MERKISSSLTEFYKVYGVVLLIIFLLAFSYQFFDSPDSLSMYFLLAIFLLNILVMIDSWQMKDVEMTDAGLIITERFFFKQKSIFVPYEKIETVKNKFWWLGNNARTSIKFTEKSEFGNEITFNCKGFTLNSRAKIIEELNLNLKHSKSLGHKNPSYLKITD